MHFLVQSMKTLNFNMVSSQLITGIKSETLARFVPFTSLCPTQGAIGDPYALPIESVGFQITIA